MSQVKERLSAEFEARKKVELVAETAKQLGQLEAAHYLYQHGMQAAGDLVMELATRKTQ